MGELIYKAPLPIPPHQHDVPKLEWAVRVNYPVGSIWKCDCGQQFKVAVTGNDYWYWRSYDPDAAVPRTDPLKFKRVPKGFTARFRGK